MTIINNNNDLYYIKGQAMPFELIEEINTQTIKYKKTMDINEAHKKLGHIAEKGVRKTLQEMGITPTGTLMKCEACIMSKAKQKPVKKFTTVRSSTPGKRLFNDTAGPYHVGVGGVKYWVQVVDNYTRIGYCFFIKSKSEIGIGFNKLIDNFKLHDQRVKFMCCDNAGENKAYLQQIANQEGIQPEFTTTGMPQFNGVAERRIAGLKQRAVAMMNAVNLSKSTQMFLWPEAIQCANTLYNVTCNAVNKEVPLKCSPVEN